MTTPVKEMARREETKKNKKHKEVKDSKQKEDTLIESTPNEDISIEIMQKDDTLLGRESASAASKEMFLKSVDPFAFVGKSTAQHADHRTQMIVSGLASLQLEESQRLKELFKATSFEQHFFKTFHPTGSLAAFASETVEERRASSKLMSPVLCASILKMAGDQKRDLPASVLEALLCSGHLTVYRSELVDRVLKCVKTKGTGSTLLRTLLLSMSDFSDAELVKLIVFVIEEGEQWFTYASEVDVFLMKLLCMPKSPLLLKTYLMALSDQLILSLLGRIEAFLRSPSGCSGHRQVILFDWLAVCIDSQYPLCVMKPEFITRLASVNELIRDKMIVDAQLAGLAGVMKAMTKKEDFMRFLPKREAMVIEGNSHYSIEFTDL